MLGTLSYIDGSGVWVHIGDLCICTHQTDGWHHLKLRYMGRECIYISSLDGRKENPIFFSFTIREGLVM